MHILVTHFQVQIRKILSTRKEARYVVSGLASEIIEYTSFFLLLMLSHWLTFSNSTSFLLGIGSGFLFHKFWSFAGNQRLKPHRQVATYLVVGGTNFILTNILVEGMVHSLEIAPYTAKLITMSITAAWSYIVFTKLIFKHRL